MFRVLLCFLIAAASLGSINAQDQWARTIGSVRYESADYFDMDANGNSYLVGRYTDSLDLGNGIILTTTKKSSKFVAKFNSKGTCEWARSFTNRKYIDRIISAALDSNGNIYITGEYQDTLYFSNDIYLTPKNEQLNSQMCYVAKYSPDGECLWAKSFSGKGLGGNSVYDCIYKMATNYDGDVYLVGQYYKEFSINNEIKLTSGASKYASYIVKFNHDGEYQWANSLRYCSYGKDNYEAIGGIRSIVSDSDGNVFVAGGFQDSLSFGNNVSLSSDAHSAGYIARYNTDGVCQWAKAIDGTDATSIISILLDAKSNLHLLGLYSSSLSFGEGVTLNTLSPKARFIAQYTSDGEFKWTTNVASSTAYINNLYLDVNGNTYLRGICDSSPIIFNEEYSIASDSSKANHFIVKYDTLGRFSWFRNICQMWQTPTLCGVVVDKDGKLYIAGEHSGSNWFSNNLTIVSNGNQDCFMAKIDPNTIIYPYQKYPINQSDYMNINTRLEWHTVVGATGYQLQVSTSANFTSPFIDEVLDQATTMRALNNLQYNTKYYWRMQTLINNDTTVWSPIWTFRTRYNPNAQIWAQAFDGRNSYFNPSSMVFDSSNNCYLLGENYGDAYLGDSRYMLSDTKGKGFVAKFDSTYLAGMSWSQNSTNKSRTISSVSDSQSNIYITGLFSEKVSMGNNIILTSAGKDDGYLAKYTSTGECLWAKSFGGGLDDFVAHIVVDKYGDVYVAGNFSDTIYLGNNIGLRAIKNLSTKFFAKYDTDGNCLWANTYGTGGLNIDKLTLDYENSLYIAGSINDKDTLRLPNKEALYGKGWRNSFIVKYDSLRRFIGVKSYTWENDAKDLIADSLGNLYVVGSFLNQMNIGGDTILTSNYHKDGYIVKYDIEGEFLWAKQLKGAMDQEIESIKQNSKGELFVFGTSAGAMKFDNGTELTCYSNKDVFVAKLNSDGDCLWAKSFGTQKGEESLFDVDFDNKDNICFLGEFQSQMDLGNWIILNSNYDNDRLAERYLIRYKAFFVDAPALIAPVCDMNNINPSSSLVWSQINAVNKYRVQVSTTQDFAALTVNKVTNNTSADFTSLLDSTKYYWRVKGITDTDSTDWSVTWSFTTGTTADVPESNNEIISISPLPVQDEAIITYNVENAKAGISIELYDLKGTIVATYNFTSLSECTNILRIDVSNIPSGMYNAVIKNGAAAHNAKLIKVD